MSTQPAWLARLRHLVLGRARHLSEDGLFHRLSLVVVLAWVGLGADGLSSSCYGPEEVYKHLLAHPPLAVFVAAMTGLTVWIISASYAQIIALFPGGGGGYGVASRLISPTAGVVSGCALLVDYVLTIAISIASAMDAVFSLLPPEWAWAKLGCAALGIGALTVLNLRGVRESVLLFAPIFFLFLTTHGYAILHVFWNAGEHWVALPGSISTAVHEARSEWGTAGLLLILLRAYALGAGTYTGIEAVSNGLPILREPRVRTGLRTMTLMALSLGGMASGLLLAYLLSDLRPEAGKTLNAVLFSSLSQSWNPLVSQPFLVLALGSAAALLFIAAQAGLIDGPRVLANMALDRWMPTRFAALSDRFVTLNGIVLMGGAALLVLWLCHGSVEVLVVLYSINVFITFSLSQLGMVRHGWKERQGWPARGWWINAVGLILTSSILIALLWAKFFEGGWVTLVVTGALVAAAFGIRRHYRSAGDQLRSLQLDTPAHGSELAPAPDGRVAVVLVNGFNGLGLHTLLGAVRLFRGQIRRFVFVQVGLVDAGNFKGADEIENLRRHTESEAQRYVDWVQQRGGEASAVTVLGRDVVDEVTSLAPGLAEPSTPTVFVGGQLVWERESFLTRWLHNHTVFALQRRLFLQGLYFLIVPIRIQAPTAV